MKLYLISQDVNWEYDTYRSAVVAAESEEKAIRLHPNDRNEWENGLWVRTTLSGIKVPTSYAEEEWTTPNYVNVKYIGVAAKGTLPGVICSSFRAG